MDCESSISSKDANSSKIIHKKIIRVSEPNISKIYISCLKVEFYLHVLHVYMIFIVSAIWRFTMNNGKGSVGAVVSSDTPKKNKKERNTAKIRTLLMPE